MSRKINIEDSHKEIVDKILLNLDKLKDEDIIKSIKLYRLIRKLYKRNRDILKNQEFKCKYSSFYRLSAARLNKDDRDHYFSVMAKHIHDKDEMSVMQIVDDLKTVRNKNNYYVFATKLMNFIDDNKYPIIDRRIANYCGLKYPWDASDYQTITSVYEELKKNEKIKAFLENKKLGFSGIGIMKQIDIIVWNIAKRIPEKKKKIKGK